MNPALVPRKRLKQLTDRWYQSIVLSTCGMQKGESANCSEARAGELTVGEVQFP